MGSKGSATTTTSTAPNPAAMAAYQRLIGGAEGVAAANPFQTYSGEFTAPINAQQYGGIGGINRYAEAAQPYITQAADYARSGATPIGAGDIQNYYNPWQHSVIDATQAQFEAANAKQQQQVLGNAALAGALGGDRTAVAQANLAGEQARNQAPIIAGLESQGFNQAAQLALAAKQQQAQGAYSLGNLGVAGQQAGLTGAGAQIQAGTLEQQNRQQLNDALYRQFLMQQAFPYQQWQWLAGIDTGVGSQMGGTSSTTGPAPSLLAQLGGLGLGTIGVLGGTGGFGPQGYLKTMFSARGGAVDAHPDDDGVYRVPGFADGGVPVLIGQPLYAGVSGFIPQAQITRGQGLPKPPGVGTAQSGADKMIADAQRIASAFKGMGTAGNRTTGAPMALAPPPAGEVQAPGMAPEAGFGEGPLYARGGLVDHLPRHDRISVPTRAGFGLGSFLPHRQEGGDVVEVPASEMPQEVDPAAIAAWRASRDLELPPQITGGVGPGAEALPYAETKTAGMAPPSSIADRIIARYGNGAPPATLRPGVGESVPWSSAQSNLWPSLMAAGLGMMASRSPFPGVAIGEGGLRGLETYHGLGREQRAEAMSQQKINQAADNLALHAEQAQKQLALHTQQFEEAKRQHREPFGWTVTPEGVKPTIGGPHDPEQIKREAEAKGDIWVPFTTAEGAPAFFNKKTMETRDAAGNVIQSAPPAGGTQPPAPRLQTASAGSLDGIVLANSALVESGQPYNYTRDAPYIEKGMQVPEPAGAGGKSQQTLKTDAEYYLQTGKLPPVARGNSPVAVQQNNYRNAVQNYGNAVASSRGMTPEQVAVMWREAPGMLRFILGADGRSTVSLGTAVRHLDTMKQLADAWNAYSMDPTGNNIQTLNRIKAAVTREFGSEAATNLSAAGKIIGPEIIKAIGVAGAGGEREREAMERLMSPANSPEQLSGTISTLQKLLGGQLEGRKRQAANAGISEERFKSLIGERPYEILSHADKGAGSSAPARSPADQQALDWATANPRDPRAIEIKKRLGVP